MIRVGIECEQLEQDRFGIGNTLAQLLRALTETPHIRERYTFILYFKKELPKDDILRDALFKTKVLMRSRGLFKFSFNIFYHILLPWRFWRDKLDVFLFPSNMLPAFFVGKAVVVLVNDVYYEAHHGTIPFRYRISYLLFCWWAAKRATIMTISEFSRKELQRAYHIPDKRIFVNPWGIEPKFHTLSRDRDYSNRIQQLKQTLGIDKDFFLSVGQAFPRRYIKEAMEAFGTIARDVPNIQYVVACTDKYNPLVLTRLAADINKKEGREAIVLHGYLSQEDLPYIMNEAKALIYVSSKEAFGLPPVESVLSGTPVILADTPTTHELFGEHGFFVPIPINKNNIAKQMKHILSNNEEAKKIASAQAERVLKLNWERHTARLLAVFHEIAYKN